MSYVNILPSNTSDEIRAVDKIGSSSIVKLSKSDFNLLPQSCKKELLPHLAYMYDLDISGLEEQKIRDYISSAFEIKKYQGTPFAIKKVFEALKIKATLNEWFKYAGEPFHFKVDLSLEDKEITPNRANILISWLNTFSNVKSVLDELSLSYMQSQRVGIASGGIGEVSCKTEMLEGYSETLKGIAQIRLGASGEVSFTAYQI